MNLYSILMLFIGFVIGMGIVLFIFYYFLKILAFLDEQKKNKLIEEEELRKRDEFLAKYDHNTKGNDSNE